MHRPLLVATAAVFWLFAAAWACASHIPEYALVDGGEGGTDAESEPSDAVVDGNEDAQEAAPPPPVPMGQVRVAVWSPDITEVDFCVESLPAPARSRDASAMDAAEDVVESGSAMDASFPWQGPLVAQAVSETDGGIGPFSDGAVPGISYPQVTRYFEAVAGDVVVRLVAAGSSDCETPLVVSSDVMFPLRANEKRTVVVAGDFNKVASDPPLTVVPLADDSSAEPGRIALRFVAALPALSVVTLSQSPTGASSFEPLFVDVPFARAGSTSESRVGAVDSNGYVGLAPLSHAALKVSTSEVIEGGPPILVDDDVTIAAGTVATLAAVGDKTGDPLASPTLVLCQDAARVVGLVLSDCTELGSSGE